MLEVKVNTNGELIASRCTCVSATVAAEAPVARSAAAPAERGRTSYGQILKSSALVGGAQVANIAIGIVRTKAMALLLGPAGFGLFGLYGSIQNLTQSIAGMGINSSGVRQIAEAVGTGDKSRVAKTAAVLRRTAVVLGAFGGTLLVVFSRQISWLTFGNTEHAAAVALLSLVVLFGLISGGQGALIQGMRRIGDLAKMNVLGAFYGLCASVPLVYFFRQQGVVPSLVLVAGMSILTSWWYSRKIAIEIAGVTFSEVRHEASALLKLGSAFMASTLMTMGVAYAVRIMVLRKLGYEATGLYQSAWTLGGLYVSFILQAMGADFYPRLTASINEHEEANRLVNEQTFVGLLLAGPGVLATLTLAPVVMTVLYSARFANAVEVLRWICLGATLQVISWPMGFIVVAKGRQGVFFLSEMTWTLVSVFLAWLCMKEYGLKGAGIAFFGSYVFHILVTYCIVHVLTGFRWSVQNKHKGAAFLASVGAVFSGFYLMPFLWAAGFGLLATLASCIYSIRLLLKLVPPDQVPRPVRRLLVTSHLLPPELHGSQVADGWAVSGRLSQ